MANINLLAPLRRNFNSPLRVKVLSIMAASRWGTYACYPYVFGVGRELHEIPLHICGSEIAAFEHLARVQRLIHFMDATGCKPIVAASVPESHRAIPRLAQQDHVSYWYGPNEEPLVLVEPYTAAADIQAEIAKRGLAAWVLGSPGIYGGGGGATSSVLLTSSCNEESLHALSLIQWQQPLVDAMETDWYTAKNLAKGVKS